MSKNLGPIHHWLYRKISIQNMLGNEIIKNSGNALILGKKTDHACGKISDKPLEEIIDTDNIHGFLQELVNVVEKRLAFVAGKLLSNKIMSIEAMSKIAYNVGLQNPIEAVGTTHEVFNALNDMLLDGMPCDRVNQIIDESDSKILWQQTTDLHLPFWQDNNIDVSNYYILRENLVLGALNGTDFTYGKNEDRFIIEKVEK
ncbi:MAG: hypothetical protein ACK5KQ_03190 [Anaerorhabdus sp.]